MKQYLACMMNVLQQDTGLWEIWIEYDQFHPEYFGTLYVHGEIPANTRNSSFTKVNVTGCQLTLQLPFMPSGVNRTREVLYSEPVKNLNQYTSVCIYAGEELIGCFNDIETII